MRYFPYPEIMFRSRNVRNSTPVAIYEDALRPENERPDWNPDWKPVLRLFKLRFFSKKDNCQPSYSQLDSPLEATFHPRPMQVPLPPSRVGAPKHGRRVSWTTSQNGKLQKNRGPPVPPKDPRFASSTPQTSKSSFLRRAISRSKKRTQSVSCGTPVIVTISKPRPQSQLYIPPVHTSYPQERRASLPFPMENRTSTSRISLARKPVGTPALPKSAAYIPQHAARDANISPTAAAFPNNPFSDRHVEDGLRQYALYNIQLSDPAPMLPLHTPTDYASFVEASRLAAHRISNAQWDREVERKDEVWGVMDDITKEAEAPVISRAVSTTIRPVNRPGRPLSRAGSIIERVGEYIKPTRQESIYSQCDGHGIEAGADGVERSWSLKRTFSVDHEGNRLQRGATRRKRNSMPPTAAGLQRFNVLASHEY